MLKAGLDALLSLEDGRRYAKYVARPAVQGGATRGTAKRYAAVFDKFAAFAAGAGVRYWQQVTRDVLGRYGRWLDDRDCHDKTQYLELTVLKQALKWMVGEGLLPPASHFRLPLKKPTGTSTYCYTPPEVRAIVGYCRATRGLHWLADVVALAVTGLPTLHPTVGPEARGRRGPSDSRSGRNVPSPAANDCPSTETDAIDYPAGLAQF